MAKEPKPRLTKEDLDARFSAQQEKNRERRETKITPEDVEQRLAARRAQKAKDVTPGRRARTVSMGLGIALLVCSGALVLATSAGTDAFTHSTEVNAQRIAAATGELAALPAADDQSAAEYLAELEAHIADATAKGEEVADLQQQFATILFQGNTETSGNGAPSTAFRDSVEHRKALAPYFVERSFLVDDALAYAPGSSLPFDSNKIDPRFPWHVSYEVGSGGRTVADPAQSEWRLASVMATSNPGVLEVTWLNSNAATGDLFAWATSSYYVDPGAFGNLSVGLTTLGESHTPSISKAGA